MSVFDRRVPAAPTIALAGLVAAMSASAVDVRVTGDRVNLRTRPDGESEVVGQVSRGTVLKRLASDGDWTKVAPPEGTDLWVYGELIQDGLVAVPKLMVRGGPGINYKSVGHLLEGDGVTVRGEQSGWLRIAPTPGSYVWISSGYVQRTSAPAEPAAKPSPAPAVKPVPRPAAPKPPPERSAVKPVGPTSAKPSVSIARPPPGRAFTPPVRPTAPPARPSAPRREPPSRTGPGRTITGVSAAPAPVDLKHLVSSRAQGRRVEMRGTLRPAARAVWRRPGDYRLVQRDRQGRSLTVCYVAGKAERLDALLGRSLLVAGREYWVQGVLHPVIVVESLTDTR